LYKRSEFKHKAKTKRKRKKIPPYRPENKRAYCGPPVIRGEIRHCSISVERIAVSGEMPIELVDSWFYGKSIKVGPFPSYP